MSTPRLSFAIAAALLVTVTGCTAQGDPADWFPSSEQQASPRTPAAQPLPLPAHPAASLPADGVYHVGSTKLVGHRRFVDNNRAGRPVLWTTDAIVPDTSAVWTTLVKRYATTGLYPVMLSAVDRATDGYPWLEGGFDRTASTTPPNPDETSVLRELYADNRDGVDYEHPPRRLPPLQTTWRTGPDLGGALRAIREIKRQVRGRIGLVAAARPADVPFVIGWEGATNYFDSGTVTTVLRSWEDRYGAQLIDLDVDQLLVSVPNPPRTLDEAKPIALEYLAFCPDVPYQDGLDETARSLVGTHAWSCWWD